MTPRNDNAASDNAPSEILTLPWAYGAETFQIRVIRRFTDDHGPMIEGEALSVPTEGDFAVGEVITVSDPAYGGEA